MGEFTCKVCSKKFGLKIKLAMHIRQQCEDVDKKKEMCIERLEQKKNCKE